MADLLPSSRDPDAGDGADPRVIGVDSDDADDLLAALQSETARELLAALYDDPATPSELAEAVDTSIQNVRYHLERLTDADLVEVADTVYSEKGREMKVYAPAAKPLVVFAGGEDDAPGLQAALSRLLGGLGVLGLSSLVVQRLFGPGSALPDLSFGAGSGGGSAAATTTAENVTAPGPNADAATETESSGDVLTGGDSTTVPEDDAAATEATVEEATRTAAETTQSATEAPQTVTEATRTVTEQATEATTTVSEAGGAALGGLPPGALFFAGGAVVLLALAITWYVRDR